MEGGWVDERKQLVVSTLLGAAIGGVFGYLYLTERGRVIRARIEPVLDEILEEIHKVEHTVDRTRVVAAEGRRVVDGILQKPFEESVRDRKYGDGLSQVR